MTARALQVFAFALLVSWYHPAAVGAQEVYEIVVAGNVTMMQLALGIDPEPLSMAPFVVATHQLPPALASDFGVAAHPRAPAFVFPSLGPTAFLFFSRQMSVTCCRSIRMTPSRSAFSSSRRRARK